jgi:hypothetical protein
MSHPDHDGKRTALATGAVLLLPALCCGLPLLIAGGALAGLGSVLGSPWLIGAAVALLAGVLVWRVRRRTGTARSADRDRCAPEPQPGDQSRTESPTRRHEQ